VSTSSDPGQLPPLVEPGPELDVAQRRRYSRHLLLPEVGAVGQRRLAAARVAVVGAGGLGSPALLYLAAAGVGTIGVIDADVVEESNLQRQVIHPATAVGTAKVDSAAEAIRAVNPGVEVVRHRVRLDSGNALDVLAGYDLVLDGADNFPTRYLVGDACELLGTVEVWGSVLRFDGQVSVFWPGRGPVYRDLFPSPPPPGSVPSCADGGVLGMLCGAVGSVMATEAVKLICGIGRPLVGRVLIYDALAMTWQSLAVRADPDRKPVEALIDYDAWCSGPPAAAGSPAGAAEIDAPAAGEEIDAPALAGMLAERRAGRREFTLIDVREAAEREIVTIEGAVHLPLADLLDAVRAGRLPEVVPHGPLVLHCKSGGRSAQALTALRAAGRGNVVHLAGGVLAWVRDVQPHLPGY